MIVVFLFLNLIVDALFTERLKTKKLALETTKIKICFFFFSKTSTSFNRRDFHIR